MRLEAPQRQPTCFAAFVLVSLLLYRIRSCAIPYGMGLSNTGVTPARRAKLFLRSLAVHYAAPDSSGLRGVRGGGAALPVLRKGCG